MSRNMIGANQELFATLERYCLVRDQPIESAGGGRYVATNAEEKRLLKDLKVGTCIRFGNHRSLTHLFLSDSHYIGTVGFEFEPGAPNLTLIENNAGLTVCLLVESRASPLASPPTVRNIVEVGSRADVDYSGHESRLIESLFPSIQVLQSTEPLDDDSLWRLCLMICAEECKQGGSWIEHELASELVALTDLNIPSMPYSAICRSIFDADPRSLFMALYRCLEATYSHQSSRRLIDKLALNISWQDMAAALESEIGWHPQESASLNVVLQHTVESDLEAICDCLRVEVGKDVQASAGRAVYSLRNSVVHFRPGTREIGVDEIDWNRLCLLLIRVVFDVFIQAYS